MRKVEVSIPEPCLEEWDAMSASERGRHCAKCDKEVMDFTGLDKPDFDKTVADIYNRRDDICGRFNPDQLSSDKPDGRLELNILEHTYSKFQLFVIALVIVFCFGGLSSCRIKKPTAGPPIMVAGKGYSLGEHLNKFKDRCRSEATAGVPIVRDTIPGEPDTLTIARNRLVQFDTDLYNLDEEDLQVLNQLISDLANAKDYSIEIIGHTDNVGKAAYNKRLSMNRANAVKDFLEGQGIAVETCRAVGFQFPIANNASMVGRKRNRRVEIIIHNGTKE